VRTLEESVLDLFDFIDTNVRLRDLKQASKLKSLQEKVAKQLCVDKRNVSIQCELATEMCQARKFANSRKSIASAAGVKSTIKRVVDDSDDDDCIDGSEECSPFNVEDVDSEDGK